MIYLDNGATSLPKPDTVIRSMAWAAGHLASPGRGSSQASEQADELLYNLRLTAGELFHCDAQSVVLTTSATHGLNIAIKSLVRPGDRVVISGMEHNAVVRPLHAIGAQIEVARGELFSEEKLLEDFDRLLTPETRACVVTHGSNVFGWILPVEEIAAMCREREIPLKEDGNGNFEAEVELEAGVYQYKFIVNGNWMLDLDNSDITVNGMGTLNNVLKVEETEN